MSDVSEDSEAPLVEGQRIGGRYIVGQLLDSGGMGSVYLAHDADLGRNVALKTLPKSQWDDPRAVERFMRQARALARVEHRNVVRVYDRGLHDNRIPYVVMERLSGQNLASLLRDGALATSRALHLVALLCDAVHAVHAQGVLHRDLKPANVFLAVSDAAAEEATQPEPELKLLDFGIAKLDDAAPLTGTQDLLGTFTYMAPELLEPGAEASVRSEVYAIACILYQLLCGVPPFRARTRPQLIAAIAHDAPQALRARGQRIPQALDALVLRGLAKNPAERPESARALATELRALAAGLAADPAQSPRRERLAQRYELLERLGHGGFGVVYAALDHGSGSQRVALKRLRALHSGDLYRLKREFRTLLELSHPNLVRRYELQSDGSEAFFTMELIDGDTFTSRLQRQPEAALSLLTQLVSGLGALHAHGLVHRDLKPSNVMVDRDGRAVLLDFGLTAPAGTSSFVAGTARYLAPEIERGGVSPASDLYALGVMLQELRELCPALRTGSLAEPLLGLSRALTQRDPELRPTAAALLSQLRALASEPSPLPSTADDASYEGSLFEGRHTELAALEAALERVSEGAPAVVWLRGDSGIGKSALLARAARALQGRALCLASCCRDSERIPFPALDAAIDALSDHLAGLTTEAAGLLLPRHAHALAQLFPVLDRVTAINRRPPLPRDPSQVRSLAYAALHRLLLGLSQQRPLVLFVDDIHWIDQDSASLLAYLLDRPDPPALLLVGALRSDLEASPVFAALRSSLRVPAEVIGLRELDADASERVVQKLLPQFSHSGGRGIRSADSADPDLRFSHSGGRATRSADSADPDLRFGHSGGRATRSADSADPDLRFGHSGGRATRSEDSADPDLRFGHSGGRGIRSADSADPDLRFKHSGALTQRILALSGGQPFLLSVLTRYVRSSGDEAPQLERALTAPLAAREPAAQHLLECLCISEWPLPLPLSLRASGADPEHARMLRQARLARSLGVDGQPGLEPYHARVRAAVLSQLPAAVRCERHAALAEVLLAEQERWPEATVEHLAGAGRGDEAARIATRAAERATEQLAFERAAALYAIALRHGTADAAVRCSWLELRATALRNAGRSVDAAEALEAASRIAEHGRAEQLLRKAGELLLFAGQIERGLALLAPLLARAGLGLPREPHEALARAQAGFAALCSRPLQRPPRGAEGVAGARSAVELGLSIADGLALVDPRGVPFAIGALQQALELDDPALLQHALATFVTLTAGLYFNPLIEPALALCRELTDELDTPYARALLYAAQGEAAHFSGRFLVAEAVFEQAERLLLEACVGTNRELSAVRNGSVLIEYAQKGDFASQLERTLGWQAAAQAHGNVFHENVLRIAHSIVWIAQDDPERARRELERTARAFAHGGGAYEVGMLEFWDIIDRYEGRADVHLRPLQGRNDIVESPAAQSPFLAGYVHLQRAWGAIRRLAGPQPTAAERALATGSVRALRTLGPEIWQAAADAFEGNLLFLAGDRDEALAILQRAETTFRRLHMRCLAACARLRHGELSSGAFGERLVREATAELAGLGVRRPERWSRAYFSLFDPEQAPVLTLLTTHDA